MESGISTKKSVISWQSWQTLMQDMHLQPNRDTYQDLVNAYAEKHRHYHTAQHIEACLKHAQNSQAVIQRPAELQLALWFHDAIYEPYRSDNELKSAQWAQQFLQQQSVDVETVERVHALIMATLHTAEETPLQDDQAVMVDIDLSILGQRPDIYQRYEQQVRQEYRWVPFFLYRKKRKEILHMFLNQSRIYHTDHYHDAWEQQARQNIKQAIQQL